jgi:hypothetical protein
MRPRDKHCILLISLPSFGSPSNFILWISGSPKFYSDPEKMASTGSKAVIKNADMSEEMQADAIDCATQVREELDE